MGELWNPLYRRGVKVIFSEKFLLGLLFCVWCLEFFGHIHFLNTHFQNYINSDYAGDAVFAKHLADTGNFILSSDWLPTTELYIVHHQLIMTPLFYFISDYKTVWLITSVLAYVMLSSSIIFFMRSSNATKVQSLLAVVLFFNPLCKLYLEYNIYFHGYLFYFVLGFLIMGSISRVLIRNQLLKNDVFVLCITSFLGGLCGIRMFMIVFTPLLISFLIINYNTLIRKLNPTHLRILGVSLIASMLGAVLYFVLGKYCIDHLFVYFGLQDVNCIIDNILDLPKLILRSIRPVSETQCSIIGCVLFWVYCLFRICKFRTTDAVKKSANLYNWLKTFVGVCILFNLFVMVFTLSSEDFSHRARYLVLSGYLLIPLFVLTLREEQTRNKLYSVIVVCIFCVCGGCEYKEMTKKEAHVCWRDAYIRFLVDNNLKFGVSTYWNANATIFLSENAVEILPIEDEINLAKYPWNTRKSYLNRKPQFLLLTTKEFENRKKHKKDDIILYQDDYVVILKI